MSYAAAEHFRIYFFGAVARLLAESDAVFLRAYRDEIAERGLDLDWNAYIEAWEHATAGHLPLRALRAAAGLDHLDLLLLMCAGLSEEDPRFTQIFEGRPTLALLTAWWREEEDASSVRGRLRRLLEAGLLRVVNPDAARGEWAVDCPPAIWDLVRGETPARPAPGIRYVAPEALTGAEDLVLDARLRDMLPGLLRVLRSGDVRAVEIRGPRRNGRGTLAGAIARALGRGVLSFEAADNPLAGPMCALLNAVPVFRLEPGPGEALTIPELPACPGPVLFVAGKQGGLTGPGCEGAFVLDLELPAAATRAEHWKAALGAFAQDAGELGERFRLTGGNIRRAAGLARAHTLAAGRATVTSGDARQACRALNRQALETLATRMEPAAAWDLLAAPYAVRRELYNLELRCRYRERLGERAGGAGVRALLKGPSGAGKTLTARILAGALALDLYRLDLAAAVSKYIGETEKNLNQAFARAEELDVILLLDEGDALLTQRTGVQNSNDRYANLETSFLLQRLETFEGILLVTTNAGDRIDYAFQRRMDVVVEFRPPEAAERWAIWGMHLPQGHTVDCLLLEEAAARCALSGGQIRNAALHASLLALEDGGAVTTAHVEQAIRREYRKAGELCPLRTTVMAGA